MFLGKWQPCTVSSSVICLFLQLLKTVRSLIKRKPLWKFAACYFTCRIIFLKAKKLSKHWKEVGAKYIITLNSKLSIIPPSDNKAYDSEAEESKVRTKMDTTIPEEHVESIDVSWEEANGMCHFRRDVLKREEIVGHLRRPSHFTGPLKA